MPKFDSFRRLFLGVAQRDRASARSIAARMGGGLAVADFPLFFPPTITSVNPTSGLIAGGDVITITGTNFLVGATVLFGTTPATSVIVNSPTSITCTTPAHSAGTVRVTVTNFTGQSAIKVNAYTYISLIIPDDAGTIFHSYVKNGVVKNLFGTITEVGAVARVGSTSMGFPNGKSAEGIGPFDPADYFALPVGLFNFSTDLWVTIVMGVPPGTASNFQCYLSGYSGTTSGPQNSTGFATTMVMPGGNSQEFIFNGSGSAASVNPGGALGSIAIQSHALTGGNFFVKRDQNATATSTPGIATFAPFTGIGQLGSSIGTTLPNGATGQGFGGVVFELRVTRTPASAAALDALHAAIIA